MISIFCELTADALRAAARWLERVGGVAAPGPRLGFPVRWEEDEAS